MLVSAVQRSEPAVRVHTSPLLWVPLPFTSPQGPEWRSLSYNQTVSTWCGSRVYAHLILQGQHKGKAVQRETGHLQPSHSWRSPGLALPLGHSVTSGSLRPTGRSAPGSSVNGIFSGNNTGVGCHLLLQKTFPPRDRACVSCVSCLDRWVLCH